MPRQFDIRAPPPHNGAAPLSFGGRCLCACRRQRGVGRFPLPRRPAAEAAAQPPAPAATRRRPHAAAAPVDRALRRCWAQQQQQQLSPAPRRRLRGASARAGAIIWATVRGCPRESVSSPHEAGRRRRSSCSSGVLFPSEASPPRGRSSDGSPTTGTLIRTRRHL